MATSLGEAIVYLKANSTQLNEHIRKTKSEFQRNFGEIAAMGQKAGLAITAVGAGIVGTMGLAAKGALNFRDAMAEVNTLGVKDLDALGDAVKDVSATYGQDLTTSVKAAYQAISAGATEAQAPKVLAESAKAAAAGVTDLATSVELGMGMTNAFGGSVENLSSIFDEAFIAVKNGVTTFPELARSAGQVAPTFAAVGLTSREMFASVSALTKAAIPTSEAFTAMKAVIAGIIKPTTEATKTAEALGIEFNAAALESMGLAGFLEQIKEKTGGNVEIMGKLFGSVEALNGVLALTGTQAGAFAQNLNDMSNGQGAANEAFNAFREGNPAQTFREMTAQLEVLKVEIGEALLPVLIDLFNAAKPLLERFRDFIKENPELTASIVKAATAFGLIAVPIGALLMALPTLATGWGLVKGAVLAVGAAIGGISAPVALAVGAIAGLVIGGIALWRNWDTVVEKARELWTWLKELFVTGAEAVGNIIGQAVAWWVRLFTDPVGTIKDAWSTLTGWIGQAVDYVLGWFQKAYDFIAGMWQKISGMVNDVLNAFGGGFQSGLSGALAEGGPVRAGARYLVGEEGPEVFVPNVSGRVVPNDKLSGAGLGGGPLFVVHGGLHVREEADVDRISRQLYRLVQTGMGHA